MRRFAVCGLVGVLLGVVGFYTGLLPGQGNPGAPKADKPRSRFPQDLAPAAQGLPVPQAAGCDGSAKQIRMAILRPNGTLHPWHDKLPEEWQAETVEGTHFVLVVGGQHKTHLSTQRYPNGAPPVARYQFELEASVVEAKTGKVLAYRHFLNVPRPVRNLEIWELTTIGEPVAFQTVFNWFASLARAEFPPEPDGSPVVNVVGQ